MKSSKNRDFNTVDLSWSIETAAYKVSRFCGRKFVLHITSSSLCVLLLVSMLGVTRVEGENLRLGPLVGTVGAQTEVEYTDNVNASETDPKPDVKLRVGPTLDLQLPLAFAGGDTMTIGASFSYEKSLMKNAPDTFSAPCNVTLMLPVYLYSWNIVLSEAFIFSNDPLETTFAFNRTKVLQYNNTLGVTATRNFGKYALTFAGSRQDQLYPDDPLQEQTSYQFSVTPSFYLRDNYSVFWRNSVGENLPNNSQKPSSTGYSTEVGISGQISDSLSGTVSIGYSHSRFRAVNLGPGEGVFGGIFDPNISPAQNLDGILSTAALNYTHPLRPNTTYSISFVRNPGVTAMLQDSNVQALSTITGSLAHKLTSDLTLAPQVSWSLIEDVGKIGAGERANLLRVQFGLSRAFTKHLTGHMNYEFQSRKSNLVGQSYDVNRITVGVNYTF